MCGFGREYGAVRIVRSQDKLRARSTAELGKAVLDQIISKRPNLAVTFTSVDWQSESHA
jgi:hypothetical protein